MVETRYQIPQQYVGPVESINAEHVGLVDRLNRIQFSPGTGHAIDFENVFTALIGELERHFAHEEKIMEASGYPSLEWHASHHAQALYRVRNTLARCRARGYADGMDVDRIYDTVIVDMTRADTKFFDFLRTTGRTEAFDD